MPAMLQALENIDVDEFATFLQRQGLAQLWLQMLLAEERLASRFEHLAETFKTDALVIAAGQLMQKNILQAVLDAFATARIDYLVFKGAQLRHSLYADPTQRWVCDIDILVRDEQKFAAIKALLQIGFCAHHQPANISHETSLVKNGVCIDLHWHLLRPGRTRFDLSDYLFEQRETCGDFAGLSKQASLLVMLIHPAITKYVNGKDAALIRLVDVHRLLQCEEINLRGLVEILRASGVQTAAWASLSWLQMLAAEPIHTDLSNQLRPGSLRTRWLYGWLRKGLNLKLAQSRLLIRAGFNMLLQDRLSDGLRALGQLQVEKLTIRETLTALQRLK